ncbi:MAG TPA: VWA domain-containing protein [Bryobacteraceae bacterium]|nr:VWA domain-containing protein [Bryobacteraceae bacterium]
MALVSGCRSSPKPQSSENPAATSEAPKGSLELVFPYGSEKEQWIKDVTESFNQSNAKTAGGQRIFVRAIPMGSGETMDEILSGRLQAHIASPASGVFIKLGNAQSRSSTGHDLIGSTDNLVLSPVVIAMWKPMAEVIGWGKKPVGWSDILALARDPQGWSAHGFPQWGQFKFGHTHPQYSNSGIISLLAEVYASQGKTKGLTMADIEKPATAQFVSAIEQSVVHYGSSTGFFGRRMFDNGPQYLSAAVLYESMVVESYGQSPSTAFPVVAIYPREGTFWSDHPIGIVERDWVTPQHREAAKIYIKYLLDRPRQEKALTYGFRPASVDVPVASPIDLAHGVDPAEPKTTLEVPAPDIIDGVMKLFDKQKKSADVALVLDISGSMNEDKKLENAKAGAKQLVAMMGDEDTFSLIPFSDKVEFASQDVDLKQGRAQTLALIDSLFAHGQTALYDAISMAYKHLAERPAGGHKIQAVVVLTDGDDNLSTTDLATLISRIKFDGESHSIRVFTIAYGSDAQKDVLAKIAAATQAKSYQGNPKNIVGVFRDVSTFF